MTGKTLPFGHKPSTQSLPHRQALLKMGAWLPALLVFALVLGAYWLAAGDTVSGPSGAPHFMYLADAFLNGRLDIAPAPPNALENDWTLFDGRWYVSFPPLPAILMMPFVAALGRDFNDVIFTMLFGAFNAALVWQLLGALGRRTADGAGLPVWKQAVLTALFAFGTVHWWVSSFGSVWFTSQILTVTFVLLGLLEALQKGRVGLVGLWLSLAGLCRPTVLLGLPVIFHWLLLVDGRLPPVKDWLRRLWPAAIPMLIAGVGMGLYNAARFGNPLELGYRYMLNEPILQAFHDQHGMFSPAFLGRNLYYALMAPPVDVIAEPPFFILSKWGFSMLLATPAWLMLLRTHWRERFAWGGALAALLVAMPSLLYFNTGFWQAGYRFSLDFLPFLLLPLALGARRVKSWLFVLLVVVSIFMGWVCLQNFFLFPQLA